MQTLSFKIDSPKKYAVQFKNNVGGWSTSHRCSIEDVAFWRKEGYRVILISDL